VTDNVGMSWQVVSDPLGEILGALPDPPLWHARAACRGLGADLFFPERGDDTTTAKQVCGGCPVRTECLASALANSERFGTWGGKAERERRQIRARRNRDARQARVAS
jgi:WhiB family redox-sensing transcriptional regulator